MEPYMEYCGRNCLVIHSHTFRLKSSVCDCGCVCHRGEMREDWPGPCAGCCNAGDNCTCGVELKKYEDVGKKWAITALHNLKFGVERLPQPTLGLAGGISRKQVIEMIEEMMKNYE